MKQEGTIFLRSDTFLIVSHFLPLFVFTPYWKTKYFCFYIVFLSLSGETVAVH